MSKIAICLSGGVKFPEKSLVSLEKIKPNENIKIFIHTWKNNNSKKINISSFQKNHPNLGQYDVLEKYNYETLLIENYEQKYEYFLYLFSNYKFTKYERRDTGVISMFYSIYKSNELKINYEKENGILFDKVVRMRFDSELEGELDLLNFPDDSLNIPNENNWLGGINDQFAFGSSHMMDLYSDIFNKLGHLTDFTYHPETLIGEYLKKARCKINQFNFHVGINNLP